MNKKEAGRKVEAQDSREDELSRRTAINVHIVAPALFYFKKGAVE